MATPIAQVDATNGLPENNPRMFSDSIGDRNTSSRTTTIGSHKPSNKIQPWKTAKSNGRHEAPGSQAYGFRKGEVIELLGNAGNFFSEGNWEIEHDTHKSETAETKI